MIIWWYVYIYTIDIYTYILYIYIHLIYIYILYYTLYIYSLGISLGHPVVVVHPFRWLLLHRWATNCPLRRCPRHGTTAEGRTDLCSSAWKVAVSCGELIFRYFSIKSWDCLKLTMLNYQRITIQRGRGLELGGSIFPTGYWENVGVAGSLMMFDGEVLLKESA